METPEEYDRFVNQRAVSYVGQRLQQYPIYEPQLLPLIQSFLGTNFGPKVKQVKLVPPARGQVSDRFVYNVDAADGSEELLRMDIEEDRIELVQCDEDDPDDESSPVITLSARHPEYPQFAGLRYLDDAYWQGFVPFMRRQHTLFLLQRFQAKVATLRADREKLLNRKRKYFD